MRRARRIGLFEIGAKRGDQIVGRAGLFIRCVSVLGENVEPDVPLNHLRHQRIHRAPASRNVVKLTSEHSDS